MIFPHLYHLQTKWQLVASIGRHCPVKYTVLHRLIPVTLHPNGRVIRMGRSRGSSRYSSNPSPTDFYVHKNIARCLFSRSKYFEQPRKALALAGGGLPLRSREAFQTYGVCALKRRLMPSIR